MAVNIQSQTFLDVENRVPNEGQIVLEEMEIRSYDSLINDIKKKKIPLAGRNKYMFIEFPINEIPSFASETLYETQLLGYVPVIVNAERNVAFRRNPNILYTLIIKGALIQIDVLSLRGENGRRLRKFAVKLCKHKFVHFVSSDAQNVVDISSFPITVNKYLQKKYLKNYVNYLQANAKHVGKGTDFHIDTPIKFK